MTDLTNSSWCLPGVGLWLGVSLALAMLGSGCRAHLDEPQSKLRTVTMRIGNGDFTLEVAETDQAREIGLMNRDSMPAGHGMIFVFDDEEERSFWMKNTRIPLDILYLDRAGRIVSIKQMEPFDLRGTPSNGPAQYVIELNVGTAAKVGVKPGDQLALPANLRPGQPAATTTTTR